MSEEYRKYDGYDEMEDDGLNIDWMDILTKILKSWKFILIFCIIFGILGIISALNMKRQWSTTITLAPELTQRTSGSLSSITSLLGMGNVQLGSTTDALNISLFPEISQSTPFLVNLFDVELTSYVSPEDAEQGVKPMVTTVYDHFSGADKPKKGLSKLLSKIMGGEEEVEETGPVDPTMLTRKQNAVVTALRSSVNASVDTKTGVTSISVVTDDKNMTRQLADTVCKALQTYFTEYRTKKAVDDYNHYVKLADEAKVEWEKAQAAYAASVDYDRNVILQSVNSEKQRLQTEANIASQIYSQMAQQRELAKAKIQEDKPVYAVIQPASAPVSPANSRKTRVLIFGFLGFVLSCAWAGIGRDLWNNLMTSLKEAMKKDEEKTPEIEAK